MSEWVELILTAGMGKARGPKAGIGVIFKGARLKQRQGKRLKVRAR